LSFSPNSPAARGFRLPAEWAPHEATWLTWPHFEGTWPGKLEIIAPIYVEMVRALRTGEAVHINALDEERAAGIRELLEKEGIAGNVTVHVRPTDNEWVRDYGALTVVNGEGRRLATDWRFNNWGEKYPDFELNNQVPGFMAEHHELDRVAYDAVMEGGSIDVNGQGWLLTTESCLLNPNRNPELSRSEIERLLRDAFGVHEILWLGDGIVGDDTDGHIDDLARFTDVQTVVTVVENDPADENYEVLQDNLQRLHSLRPDGQPLRVVELPMPQPVYQDGHRLPASYANFYVANEVVLLPAFDDDADELARQHLSAAFPGRRVVPIDCRDLVWGFGAFHCLTQQIPSR
jgi:agmatine deiminase